MNGDPRPGLPAPYESPWRLLARDLRAVAASLGLKLRELARRNRAGDLPVPSFWPQRARPLFWPLAALAVAAGLGLLTLAVPPRAGPLPPRAPDGAWAPTSAPSPESPATLEERPEEAAAPPEANAPTEVGSAAEAPPPPAAERPVEPPPSAGPEPDAPESRGEPTEAEQDPLRHALAGPEGDALVLAVAADPATGELRITLDAGYGELRARERERRAERWRRRALDLGYERLRLQDRRGVLLGRNALVGSGMILLEPPAREG